MLPHKKPIHHHHLINKMETINEIHCTEIRRADHQALAIVLGAVLATIQIIMLTIIIVERIVAVKNVHCVIARKRHKAFTQC